MKYLNIYNIEVKTENNLVDFTINCLSDSMIDKYPNHCVVYEEKDKQLMHLVIKYKDTLKQAIEKYHPEDFI